MEELQESHLYNCITTDNPGGNGRIIFYVVSGDDRVDDGSVSLIRYQIIILNKEEQVELENPNNINSYIIQNYHNPRQGEAQELTHTISNRTIDNNLEDIPLTIAHLRRIVNGLTNLAGNGAALKNRLKKRRKHTKKRRAKKAKKSKKSKKRRKHTKKRRKTKRRS